MRKVISDQFRTEVREYYKTNIVSLRQVCDKFNLSLPTVCKILADIPRYKKATLRNPRFNDAYFNKIDTEIKAYFIGLMIADGNVYRYNDGSFRQASISITLLEEDIYLLELFKKEVNCNTKITYDRRGDKVACTVACRSDLMADDLARYGIVPNKTNFTYLPMLDDSLMPALFRGILDGDGSIRCAKWRNKHLHYIGYCGSHRLMQDMVDYLVNKGFKFRHTLKVYDYRDRQLSEFKLTSYDDVFTVGDWLYAGATVYMKRKKKKYDSIKRHYLSIERQG